MTPALADQIASWRRAVNGRSPGVDARVLLRNAAQELWTTLDIDRTVYPNAATASRQEAIDALQDMAQVSGIGADDAQAIFAECFKKQPANGAEIYDFQTGAPLADDAPASPVTIKSSQQFVAGFVPPDYTVDGLMQEGFLYSLTGATGKGR